MSSAKSYIEKLSEWLDEQKAAGLVDFKEFFAPDCDQSAELRAQAIFELVTSAEQEVVLRA